MPDPRVVQLAPASDRTWRHSVTLQKQLGALAVDVNFTLTAPWTVLFAPSGGGKTTILRMIAGLDRPDEGSVVCRMTWPPLEEKEFILTDTASGLFVPPHRRAIRLVAQRPALFPHMSVLKNVQFRQTRMARDAQEQRGEAELLERLLQLCRIEHLSNKMPADLSGGERQRVALARTLAAGPGRLLLLDEPFTGLEAALRADLIDDLRRWLQERGTPVLMVTHDLAEVFAAEAEVIRLDGGRVVATGSARDVLAAECDRLRRVLG